MARTITYEMLFSAPMRPCQKGVENFTLLFGREVEVTEENCRKHAMTFPPWGAIAYIFLTEVNYRLWMQQWGYSIAPLSVSSYEDFIADGAAAFAHMFNNQEPTYGTPST